MQDFLTAEDNEPTPATEFEPIPQRIRKVDHYCKLHKYVKATSMLNKDETRRMGLIDSNHRSSLHYLHHE